MGLFKNFCRTVIGLVFAGSGFIKGIDLTGLNYKLTDYFTAFHLEWLEGTVPVIACALVLFEFLVGICLLLNIRTRTALWGALVALGFFTPLTLILAIRNPVTDCGCFGDALVLTNWQSFGKNLVLLALILYCFYHRNSFRSRYNALESTGILAVALLVISGLEIHCSRHLPLLDFLPYAIGDNIPEKMLVPEDAPQDEFEITLEYRNRNTGEIKRFTEEDYPWQDSLNWEYYHSTEKLVREGYRPAINNLVIGHPESGDITSSLLEEEYLFLAVSCRLDESDTDALGKLGQLYAYAKEEGYPFYGLTSSPKEETEAYRSEHGLEYEFCSADETEQKSMIRSNPGLLLLHKGTVIGKWSSNDIPDVEDFKGRNLLALCMEQQSRDSRKYLLFTLILACSTAVLWLRLHRRRQEP